MIYYYRGWGTLVLLFGLFLYFCVTRRKNFVFSLAITLIFCALLLAKKRENIDIFTLLYPLWLYLCLRHQQGIRDFFCQIRPKIIVFFYFLALLLCFCAFVWANFDYQDAYSTELKFQVALWSTLIFWALSKGATKLTFKTSQNQKELL